MLLADAYRVFLYRQDLLAAVLSTQVSRRAGYWGSDRERYQKLKPGALPLEEVAEQIRLLRESLEGYHGFLREQRLDCLVLSYEDVFNRPWPETWERLRALFEHVRLPEPRSPAKEVLRLLCGPEMKVNDEDTLSCVSNRHELLEGLGATRWLRRDAAPV